MEMVGPNIQKIILSYAGHIIDSKSNFFRELGNAFDLFVESMYENFKDEMVFISSLFMTTFLSVGRGFFHDFSDMT
jgi:hypothetical protein